MWKLAAWTFVALGIWRGLASRVEVEESELALEHDAAEMSRSLMRLHHNGSHEQPCQSKECVRSAAWLEPYIDRSMDPCQDFAAFTCSPRAKKGFLENCAACTDRMCQLTCKSGMTNTSYKTFTELERIQHELVDPDISPDSFLGPDLAPLVKSVRVAYEACNATGIDWDDNEHLAEVETHLVPILRGFEGRHEGERLEEVLVGAGSSDEATRAQNTYGIAGYHVNPFFGLIVALDFQTPSAGQKILMLPQLCAEYKMVVPKQVYNETATAWCLLRNQSSTSLTDKQEYVENCSQRIIEDLQGWLLNNMTEQCVPKLVSTFQDQDHSGMGAHATVGIGAGATPIYIHELQKLAAPHGLGFNLEVALDILGVPQGVQVYVPGGQRALQTWGKNVATFFEDVNKARDLLKFLGAVGLVQGLGDHLKVGKYRDRRQECTPKIQQMFPWFVGRKFSQEVMSSEKRAEAAEVAWQLVGAFADNLDKLDWLTPETRKRAKEKLRKIDIKTGYPDWIFHDHQLVRRYGYALGFTPDMSWPEMMQIAGMNNLARLTEQIAIPTDSHNFWITTPDTFNMMYEMLTNDVALLAAFTQEPLLDTSNPMAFSFGFMGSVMGHELSHGFDSGGAKRGPTGDIYDWWDNSSREQFELRKKCFVEQYSSFPLHGDNETTGSTIRGPTALLEKDGKWDCEDPEEVEGNHTLDSCANACRQKNYTYLNYRSWDQEQPCSCLSCTRNESLSWQTQPLKIVDALFDDGQKCLGENIADSGGLGLAHIAYMQWQAKHGEEPRLVGLEDFTSEQLFFMRWGAGWCDVASSAEIDQKIRSADPHAVKRLRVIGSVQNSRSFARAFNCPAGAPMNPAERCEMWGIGE